MRGTLTLHYLNSAHTLISIIFSHYACAISDPKHVGTFAPKNYHRVAIAAPDLSKTHRIVLSKPTNFTTVFKSHH
ncbi:hypothetical protein GQ44DRAFT_319744 [Phaeosphaeriaceae sp. PMI808]|nr:hypothetical protein GQ44DRAFT_319744 [Phaeosphaeriaceae sp. PMI808]